LFPNSFIIVLRIVLRGRAVALLFEALRYRPEGRGFDSRWCYSCFFYWHISWGWLSL